MVLLPALVLGAEIKRPRVLKVWWKHNSLVPSLPGKLHAEIPCLEGDEDKFEVLARQVLGRKGVELVDRIAETAGVSDVFPSQGRQASCEAEEGALVSTTAQPYDGLSG